MAERVTPDNRIAHGVDSAVDALQVEPVLAKYQLDGHASYRPVMMRKLLICACRKIAEPAWENIMTIWLCDNNKPDFR